MALLARGQASDGLRPVLRLFTAEHGVLRAPHALAFQIFDVSDEAKLATPVQVLPAEPGARVVVRVADAWPVGDQLRQGAYVAQWTPPATASIGLHEIRWFVQMEPGGVERRIVGEFDVVAEVAGSWTSGYALISELRAEGVPAKDVTDVRLAKLLHLASQYVERMTSRFFEPRAMTIAVDGSGARSLLLGQPIIAVGALRMAYGRFIEDGGYAISPSFYRVYNRHLAQELLDPDDRENPRLELIQPPEPGLGSANVLVWPWGTQNVVIDGVFGYTDPDGTAIGATPALIRHVTRLLVMRELPRLVDFAWRDERQRRWRLTSERTRDQSYTLDALRIQGAFTGDAEIDTILATYQRAPQLGAA